MTRHIHVSVQKDHLTMNRIFSVLRFCFGPVTGDPPVSTGDQYVYPYTPGWRETNIFKCLAHGHRCYDRDLNQHPDELATRI